ncbi:hypothetical protein SNOG_08474 [Parastagonospora nodorum SN15]|uniref:Uncharacterized protein n=1 Tax=Phaeosphaeria nodorum (strain SN15 / ATCC MYA-4574 / FGSC 10173) TaxID=321614 RepID=Q0UIE0_PHANO|nr:hypothetical protein SNOG_08474 [Parastagonospora nodorum SN15]EAT83642.1 hypothetical protein SNOG_08474 [Parastagonospora nodorum SN15]
MSGSISSFLGDLNDYDKISEADDGWTYWGFTIYRTYHGPDSDEQWSALLEKITDGVGESLTYLEEVDKNPDAVTKALLHFRTDARSDAATLDGMSLQDVRFAFLDGVGGQPMNTEENYPWRLFLLADAQVLQNPDLSLIKVAAPHYDPVEMFSFEYLAKGPGALWIPEDTWLGESTIKEMKSLHRDWQSQGS